MKIASTYPHAFEGLINASTPEPSTIRWLWLYVGLAYSITWLPWFWSLATGRPFGGLFSFGPLIAALAAATMVHGRAGVVRILAELVRWRVPFFAYVLAFGLPIASLALVAFLHRILNGSVPHIDSMQQLYALLASFPLVLVQGGPLGEEPGWRGFLLPQLVGSGRTPLSASFIVGATWAGWHFPLCYMHNMPPAAAIAMFFGSVTFAWLYLYSRSTLITTIFHAVGNTVGGAFFFNLYPREEFGQLVVLRITLEIIIAVGFALTFTRSKKPRQSLRIIGVF